MNDSPNPDDRSLEKFIPKRTRQADLTLADIAKAPAALVPDYTKEAELEIRSSIKRYYDIVAELEGVRTENDRLRKRCQMLEEELGQNYLRAVMSLRNAELSPPKA
jgi:hypothetical protein